MALARSLQMITTDSSIYLCAFGTFIIIFSSEESDKLTSAIFLGTLQIVMEFNESISSLGYAIVNFYTLNVVFERFVGIMNMKNVKLEQLEQGKMEKKIDINYG